MKTFKKILLCILLIAIAVPCFNYMTYKETFEYDLVEMEPGVYAYYNVVTSNIPAENYEMITACLNGRVYTLGGHVYIHYTDGDPKLFWTDVNLVHGDTFEVYVPKGSVVFTDARRNNK